MYSNAMLTIIFQAPKNLAKRARLPTTFSRAPGRPERAVARTTNPATQAPLEKDIDGVLPCVIPSAQSQIRLAALAESSRLSLGRHHTSSDQGLETSKVRKAWWLSLGTPRVCTVDPTKISVRRAGSNGPRNRPQHTGRRTPFKSPAKHWTLGGCGPSQGRALCGK